MNAMQTGGIHSHGIVVCLVMLSAWQSGWLRGAPQETAASFQSTGRVDTARLLEIERRLLPSLPKPGQHRFDSLPAYYMDANPELRQRLEAARVAFESEAVPQPLRRITLIAGEAGVGKTFIKGEIFSKNYPNEKVCRFDLRELYEQWWDAGHTEERPDLRVGTVILNNLLAQKGLARQRLTEYLREQQDAAFFIIDSLDEIHSDDHATVLGEIERFALSGDREFVHVVVLGRGFSFREYWHTRSTGFTTEQMALFTLQPPRFVTTGDLLVSTWNYHTWACKLAWSPGGRLQPMPLEDYLGWVHADYPRNGLFGTVVFQSNCCQDARVQGTLQAWACQYPVVGSMLVNLAGNTIVREACERWVAERRDYDERAVMEEYLAAWLIRETASGGRPSAAKPEHLDLYLQLLEGMAVKYLVENRLDEGGFFEVGEQDTIMIDRGGQPVEVSVPSILDRSGMKTIDLWKAGPVRYRFEPIWFHRLLVEKHNDRVRRSPIAGRAPARDSAN